MPVSNAWVGRDGPTFRGHGLWPWHWAASEADGAVKYNDRPDAAAIVLAQTEREWYLRRLGLDIARYDWVLAIRRPHELASRFAALLRANQPTKADQVVEERAWGRSGTAGSSRLAVAAADGLRLAWREPPPQTMRSSPTPTSMIKNARNQIQRAIWRGFDH